MSVHYEKSNVFLVGNITKTFLEKRFLWMALKDFAIGRVYLKSFLL